MCFWVSCLGWVPSPNKPHFGLDPSCHTSGFLLSSCHLKVQPSCTNTEGCLGAQLPPLSRAPALSDRLSCIHSTLKPEAIWDLFSLACHVCSFVSFDSSLSAPLSLCQAACLSEAPSAAEEFSLPHVFSRLLSAAVLSWRVGRQGALSAPARAGGPGAAAEPHTEGTLTTFSLPFAKHT